MLPKPVATSIPAMRDPIEIRAIDFQYLTPNRYAIKLPVQTPDPGRGIATKIMRKIEPYFSNFDLCLLRVLSNRLVKNLSARLECFLRNFVAGLRNLRMKKAGAMLPITPITNACQTGSPMVIPMGMPTLSSSPGSRELRNVASSGVRYWTMFIIKLYHTRVAVGTLRSFGREWVCMGLVVDYFFSSNSPSFVFLVTLSQL